MRSCISYLVVGLALCLGAAAESKAAIDAFKRVNYMKAEIEERNQGFAQPRQPLRKRASPYLTDATESTQLVHLSFAEI